MKVICISGSVGTGKTTLAKRLAKKLNYRYVDVNKIIKEQNLRERYDRKRRCYVVDVKKLNKSLIRIINNHKKSIKNKSIIKKDLKKMKEGIIIDSHLSHYLPKKYVDLCIVTKSELKTQEKRLKRRRYNKSKIKENLECEIFDVCLNEAKELKHRILVVDATKQINMNKIIKRGVKR